MNSVHNYNILSNQTWYDKYMYIPYNVPKVERANRVVSMYKDEKLKLLSLDVVRCVSDLAYMPEEFAKDMEFNPIYLERIRKDKKNDEEKPASSLIM